MKKLLTLLALCCLMVTGAWAQTVVATMQQLVGAASTTTATVSPFYTTSVTGGAVYSFTGNGGNSGTYIGGITNDAVDAAFTGSKIVTVAAWVYGRPSGCIFGYGDQNDGVKFLLSTSGTNTSFKTTTKGKLDFTATSFTLQEDAWNLVAFSVYGKASSTNSYRYYYGTTDGNYSTKTDKTMSTMNAASKFAIGSGNQGSAREVFSSDIANLTVITSDGYLNNSDIASLVGAAPTAVSHNYETYADGEFTYGPLNGNTWSNWSGIVPAELSALGSTYNATNLKVIEKYYTFTESGELDATFSYTSGNQRLDIAGIQVFSSTGVKIDADFHVGMAGSSSSGNGYSVFIPEGGSYIVRYISTANCGSQQNTNTNGKVANVFTAGSAPAFPVQDGKTYYIYNANWNNNTDVQYYLHPSGSDLALSTSCLEETAYMWTCVKNGAYYNFRNVATGKWLGHKGMNNNAYNFLLARSANSEGCLTLYSVDAQRYMVVNNAGNKFDQSTKVENKTAGWSSDYGFTECSISDLYFSESLASDKVKWLRAANCSNTGYVMTVKDDDTAGSNLHTAGTDAAAEGQLFAFVGNQENGFVIYNKKLGNTYTLTAANTNEGTAATWVLNAETPTKWYLDESQLNASSQPGYGITTSSTSGGRSLNMWAGNGGDAKFYANGAGNGGSRWQFSLVDGTPTVINYVVSGTKAHNDANNYIGVLNITKGTFVSNTYVGTDVNGKTFNAYLPKTQEPISISNTNLHGWNYELTGSDGNYTVTYTADENTDYQYLAFDKSAQWYRIPAIAKAHNGDLVAIYDYRVCHNDVGFGEVDQVMRRSTDGGATWSAETKIADGNGGGNHFGAAYGDPALVADRESDNMTLITVSGQQSYPGATATSRPMVAALYSSDNGQHWSDPVDITSQFWGSKGAMFQDEDTEAASTTFAYSGFFGSGKILQSRFTKVGSYYRLYAAMLCRGKNVSGAYVVYSDDMGRNWSLLGGNNTIKACSGSDEPKVEELPDGSIVLSGRKSYGRYFNIWTWVTKPTAANKAGEGFWGTDVQSNQQTNGISVGSNACNGEILLVDVKNSTTGQPAKLMLQSLPSGNSRDNVEIWYKDVTDDSAYSTVSTFASNWTRGLRVSTTSSAYSTMTEQADGRIGFFYEEGPATYCMVYVPLSISQITNNAYEKEAVVPVGPVVEAYTLYPADGATVEDLEAVSVEFTGENAGAIDWDGETLPTLTKQGSESIEGTVFMTDFGNGYLIFEDVPDGEWTLTVPDGLFVIKGSGTDADTPVKGFTATYTVVAPVPTAGRVYTIKAHFTDKTDLYLTSNTEAENLLLPMPTEATANQSYWVAEDSGNESCPWNFKSGYGYAMSLTESNPGLTAGGTAFSVSANNNGTYCLIDSSNRYVGTWGANDDGHKGFGSYGVGGNCWKTGGRNSAGWSTDYEIVEVAGVKAYKVVCAGADGGITPAVTGYNGLATVKNGGYIIVPAATELNTTNFPAVELEGFTSSVTFEGKTISVKYVINVTDNVTYGALANNAASESWALVTSATEGLLGITGAGYTVTTQNLRVLERIVNVEEAGGLASTFVYSSGNHRIDIAGVELIDADGNIIASDYHFGYSGGQKENNTYNVFAPAAGEYTIRYYSLYTSGSYDTHGTINNVFTTVAGLQAKIDNAMENILTDRVGYPKKSAEEVTDLADWKTSAVGSPITDGEHFTQALDAYNDVVSLGVDDLVLPENGHAYKFSVRSTDGTKRWYLKNDGGVSTNEADAAIFVMGASNNEDFGSIFVTNNNGNIKYLKSNGTSTATYAEGYCDFTIDPMVTASNSYISTDKSARFGTFYLKAMRRHDKGSSDNTHGTIILKEGNQSWDKSMDPYMNGTFSSAIEMTEVEYPYTAPNLIKNAGDAGSFASIWLPFPMIFPEGVEVYKGTQERTVAGDPYLGLTQVDTDHAVAAGGYIIYSESLTGGIQVQPVAGTPEDKHGEDDAAFFGSTEPDYTWSQFTAAHSGTPYVLANKSKGIGFYKYTGTVLPKGKAIWMKEDGSAETVKFGFDDIISAIEALHGNTSNAAIYDLQGHRLDKVQKGQINVINGKKIMFK